MYHSNNAASPPPFGDSPQNCRAAIDPSNAAAQAPSALAVWFSELSSEISRLDEAIEHLECTITPVLTPRSPEAASQKDKCAPEPLVSPMAGGLRELARRVLSLRDAVASISARLDC